MSAAVAPARRLAFAVLRETFERDAFTERAFRLGADRAGLTGRERAQAQRLAYGAVQRRGTADAAIERLAERPLRRLDPSLLAALRLGLYELLFADGTPDHAAVDQAVELVKGAGAAHAAGLVNAVLRRAAREREPLAAALLGDDATPAAAAVAHSAPLWLVELWWRELGPDGARSLLRACNQSAEVAFRISPRAAGKDAGSVACSARERPRTLSAARGEILKRLREAGVEADPAGGEWPLAAPELLVLRGRMGESVPVMVAAGELTPQSRASAAVVEVLDPQPGDHLLDLCAGPGIKTGQIATRMEGRGEVVSIELDPERAGEVGAQAERLGLRNVTAIEADVTELPFEPVFDRVLLDAPCSDLGTLASRPDARWRKSPRAIERLAAVQQGALLAAARTVRPGGVLVYSTCTISRRENEEQVAALLAAAAAGQAPPLQLEDLGFLAPRLAAAAEPRCLQLRPDRDRSSGFFIARLRRND